MAGRASPKRASNHTGFRWSSASLLPAPPQSAPRPNYLADARLFVLGGRHRLALVLLTLSLVAIGAGAVRPAAAPLARAGDGVQLEDYWLSAEMLDLLNAERAQAGLPGLAQEDDVREIAVSRSLDMAANNYFDHVNPNGVGPMELLAERGIPFRVMAENIARSSYPPPEVLAIVHGQLMASETHRRNVLNPSFGRVGIAVASSDGVYYFAVEFLD